MGKVVIIPWVWNICPLNDFNSVVDMLILGDPMAFQQEIDMMQDEAPSSMYIQKMFFPIVCTLIYKAT
jgi:hypothetical protein